MTEERFGKPPTRNDVYRVYLEQPENKFPLVFISLSLNDLFRNDEVLMDIDGNRYSTKKEL